jgi:hypothetical protein
MNSQEIDTLHELLMDFQNTVLEGSMGSAEDRAISVAISIIEEYL